MLVVVPLVVAVVAKDNLATAVKVQMATARTAGAGKIHRGSCALQLSLAALRLLLGSQGGQSKAHKEEASSEPVGCHFDGCDGLCGTGKCCRVVTSSGRELVRAATGSPKRGDKLCHLLALTLSRLRWRGAVLAVGADGERGCRAR